MCSNKQLTEFLVRQNEGKCLANIADITRLTGLCRTSVQEVVKNILPVGGPKTFFLGDVVDEMRKRGMRG